MSHRHSMKLRLDQIEPVAVGYVDSREVIFWTPLVQAVRSPKSTLWHHKLPLLEIQSGQMRQRKGIDATTREEISRTCIIHLLVEFSINHCFDGPWNL